MVKTTINLDDEIYADIVKESIEKYGSTKNMSRIINQRLRKKTTEGGKRGERIQFKVREDLASLDADSEIRKGWKGSNNENHG
ncbi:hypothetical protein B1A_00636 [mine drainage metagenome]|uniref:Uncharacterized protein n=1 Tax=mine drainage metagenome TaxID=410659 RepID=T1C5C6_9ZZZZ